MQMSNQEWKMEALEAVLNDLSVKVLPFDEKEREQYDWRFQEIFLGNFRLEPSRIFFRLTEIYQNEKQSLDTVSENLQAFCETPEAEKSSYIEDLKKLADFISLEAAHLGYMEISAEAQSRQADTLIRRVDAAAEAARNVEDKIGRVQRESVVAVGMMAAVLIVFWAAVGWSSSVLQNIEKATVYRLSGMSLLLVIGLFNLVAFLMAFIRSMTGTEDRKFYRVYMWGNGLLVLLLFLVSVAWLFDLSEARPFLAEWLRTILGNSI